MRELDRTDPRILAVLKEDSSLAIAEVAARVGLSQTPCWRRVQRLRTDGVIERTVSLVRPEALGLGLTIFVMIEAFDHSPEWLDRFSSVVSAMPQVMEVHRMAGDIDYLLRIAVADMAAFDAFYRDLIKAVPLKNVSSHFAMEQVKSTTAYPVETA